MGNTTERAGREAKEARRHRRAGALLEVELVEALARQGRTLTTMRFTNRIIEWLLTVCVVSEDGPEMAYWTGANPGSVLRGFDNALKREDVKWKEDKWAIERREALKED